MKNVFGIVFLFSLFFGVLSGVRFLDVQSSHYQICAEYWVRAADATALYPKERASLVEKFQNGQTLTLNGRACPRLLAPHKDAIHAKLTLRPPLRG